MTHQPGVYVPLRALFLVIYSFAYRFVIVFIPPANCVCVCGRVYCFHVRPNE